MIGRRLLDAADTRYDAAQGYKDLREPLLMCDLLHGSLHARMSSGDAKKARSKSVLPPMLEQCATARDTCTSSQRLLVMSCNLIWL